MDGLGKKMKSKGAHLIEYSVLIIILVLAFLASQNYLRRALSGNWRQMADSFGFGKQYEEGKMIEGGGGPPVTEGIWRVASGPDVVTLSECWKHPITPPFGTCFRPDTTTYCSPLHPDENHGWLYYYICY